MGTAKKVRHVKFGIHKCQYVYILILGMKKEQHLYKELKVYANRYDLSNFDTNFVCDPSQPRGKRWMILEPKSKESAFK